MCYGNPTKSLAIARERTTPEQWACFECEFDDFCIVNGLADGGNPKKAITDLIFAWSKWAFFSARPRQLERTDWYPCTTPPVRDGWYEVQRGMLRDLERMAVNPSGLCIMLGQPELVRFKDGAWDRESCESKIGVWVSWDCWRGVTEESK